MRRTVFIVWLMLALLPLRGWAHAGMVAANLPVPAVAQASMPCHGMAAATPAAEEKTAPANPHTACAMCDLCHATVATAPGLRLPAFDVPSAAPLARLHRDTGRTGLDRLERPPRPVTA